MKKEFLHDNFNVIKNHFRLNWKLILFFVIFWLIITVALLAMTLMSHLNGVKVPVIGNFTAEIKTSGSSTGTTLVSISQMLNWALFAGPGIVFFSIFSLVLINKNFIKEVNGGQINFWLVLPLSRKQIASAKMFYIIIANIIVFVPSFIIILIFAGISYDAKQWFGYVFLYGIQFILFIALLIMLYTLISVWLVEKTMTINIINALIAFWILITWIILLIYDMNPTQFPGLEYIKYISLQSMVVVPLKFSSSKIGSETIIPIDSSHNLYLKAYQHLQFNKIAITICTILLPILATGFGYCGVYLFNRKDLKI
ncbi:ABC transporter permease [Spiroplasma sp. DGKH1]|uniref:ABC transporter permease n=1 Tax=Spiroplasma sp. DGKH1 TaxID=3050074 RepID=UPI0034C6A2ED